MSAHLSQQLKASGTAQVIVVLRPTTPAAAGPRGIAAVAGAARPRAAAAVSVAGLEKHFRHSELSQATALSDAGLRRPLTALGGRAAAAPRRRAIAPSPPVRYYPNLGVMFGTVDRAGLAALRADSRVAGVTAAPPMSLIRPKRVAAVKMSAAQTWGIDALGVPALWKQGLSGKGVRVAHLDTGADGKHPALKGAIKVFAEFDLLGAIVTPAPKPYDTADHGTHTAATIAGRRVQGKSVGVAPGAELVSAIVIEGGQVVARVLGGLDWALSQGARVLSMSLGFPGYWEDFLPIVQILRSHNVLPVIAVGNEGPGTSRSPGNYPEALSVGAVGQSGAVANFSSSQRFKRKREPVVPDLVAPGVDIISAAPGGGYQAMDGTSMATPHVAGLAALLREAKPTATAIQVERAIFESCIRKPGVTPARANRGFPNAVRALAALGA